MTTFLLSGLSALLLMLAFPPVSLWPLAMVGLIPFFYAIEKASGKMGQLWAGICMGSLHAATMGYWIFYAVSGHYEKSAITGFLFILVFVCLPMGLMFTIFSIGYGSIKPRGVLFYLLIPGSLWILIDFAKESIPFLIPWGDIGYALTPFIRFVQIADIVGIYGVTFIVVLINACIYYTFKQIVQLAGTPKTTRSGPGLLRKTWLPISTLCGLFVLLPIYGQIRISNMNQLLKTKDNQIYVRLVQGNYSLKDRWSGMGFLQRIQTYLDLSIPKANSNDTHPDMIIWPETVLNEPARFKSGFIKHLKSKIGSHTLLISGGLRKDSHGFYNTAYFIPANGRILWYDKQILLPFAEAKPIRGVLGDFYQAPSSFETGKLPDVIPTPFGPAGVAICFEMLYPNHVRQCIQNGADFLVNLSNDGWFGKSAMPYIHLMAARFRAIENRRYVLRAANSGICAVISPIGQILEQTELFTRQSIAGRFSALSVNGIYVRYGDWVLYLAVVILTTALLRQVLKS